jgi:hypothetical protein
VYAFIFHSFTQEGSVLSVQRSIIILSFCCASESSIIANDMPCLALWQIKNQITFCSASQFRVIKERRAVAPMYSQPEEFLELEPRQLLIKLRNVTTYARSGKFRVTSLGSRAMQKVVILIFLEAKSAETLMALAKCCCGFC